MTPTNFLSFSWARRYLAEALKSSTPVEQIRWQGLDVSKDPSAQCYEVQNVTFSIDLRRVEDLDTWREDIKPNLPWADDHFQERVGREPLNPGVQWANWPWGKSANGHRRGNGLFNHSYQERFWPRWARRTPEGRFTPENPKPTDEGRQGIDRRYGDLDDVVDLLVKDPWTRQAVLPLFFPEDTGWGDGGRKMCSLLYHFMRRGNLLSIFYPLRSCDFAHHWADDCYLAVRLLLWVLSECRRRDPEGWGKVGPGTYSMWMTSLHVFANDWRRL